MAIKNGMITDSNGSTRWYENSQRHRLDGPAVIHANGHQEWRVRDQLHRLDGPAVIYPNGAQQWYENGQLHRLDGPARIFSDGSREWWVNGHDVTRQVISWMKLREVTWPWDESTQVEFLLSWSGK